MPFAFRAVIIGALLFVPTFGFAQDFSLPQFGETASLEVSPRTIIEPGASVTIAAQSSLIDLDRASLTWWVNGVHDETADGNKTFTTKAGVLGSETTVVAVIDGANGLHAEPKVTVRPTTLALLWEGDGYTPPLYRGRTLTSPGSNVIAQAEAQFIRKGVATPPQNILYTWRLNGQRLGDVSGRGKNSVRIPITELFGDAILTVEATSLDSVFHAEQSVRIPQVEPQILLYRDHPLLGIDYHHAIPETATFADSEITVAALPYFSNTRSPFDKTISYDWTIENKRIAPDDANPFLVTLSLAEKTFGSTKVGVFLRSSVNVLQSAQKQWSISLSAQAAEQLPSPFPTQ